ncbi:MAG: DUF3553 domain-containing protein [Myxococcales bacterium]|nr:DUF3553 domain-containing protein [Myxococcales bacterium]
MPDDAESKKKAKAPAKKAPAKKASTKKSKAPAKKASTKKSKAPDAVPDAVAAEPDVEVVAAEVPAKAKAKAAAGAALPERGPTDAELAELEAELDEAEEDGDDEDDDEGRYEPEVGVEHSIESARSGRARCRACKKKIERGELRLREVFGSQYSQDVISRFYHLGCGADRKPIVLRQALDRYTGPLDRRDELEARIEAALKVRDLAQATPTTSTQYLEFRDSMAKGEDEQARLVFADWLQSVGDPRGELIAAQTQKEQADDPKARAAAEKHERELMRDNSEQFVPKPFPGRAIWQRGFIERLEIDSRSDVIKDVLASLFTHPSLLLLRELSVRLEALDRLLVGANLPEMPDTLHVLELGVSKPPQHYEERVTQQLGRVSALVKSAANLRRLWLEGVADIEALSHPTLAELELVVVDPSAEEACEPGAPALSLLSRLAKLSREALPSLVSLAIHVEKDLQAVCGALATSAIFGGLRRLRLQGELTIAAGEALVSARAGLDKLETLDVSECRVEYQARAPLASICEQLLAPPDPVAAAIGPDEEEPSKAPQGDWLVRNTRKPEWGVGRVIDERDDGGLEVEFENAGLKIIRAVELLEDA